VARATPVDVMSCGMTPEDARRNLSEAVALFFKTVSAHGTLAEVLEEAGIGESRKTHGRPPREDPRARRGMSENHLSLKRWISPVAVFGSSGTNSIQRGYL